MIPVVDGMNLCLSGGAKGADVQWGMCAGMAGHHVIHWSFAGHKSLAPEVETVRLTQEQLDMANDAIKVAAPSLKKYPPKDKFVKSLIQRNFYQITESSSVYAVSTIQDDLVQGGTAWAVQMFLDRTDIETHACYVFDQNTSSWFSWSDETQYWTAIEKPPTPQGIWAGIGTRDLTTEGKNAIRELLGYVKPL